MAPLSKKQLLYPSLSQLNLAAVFIRGLCCIVMARAQTLRVSNSNATKSARVERHPFVCYTPEHAILFVSRFITVGRFAR